MPKAAKHLLCFTKAVLLRSIDYGRGTLLGGSENSPRIRQGSPAWCQQLFFFFFFFFFFAIMPTTSIG